ncbi:unnamed protein product [Urochloa humidicola]
MGNPSSGPPPPPLAASSALSLALVHDTGTSRVGPPPRRSGHGHEPVFSPRTHSRSRRRRRRHRRRRRRCTSGGNQGMREEEGSPARLMSQKEPKSQDGFADEDC